jgi:hypothetical protein
MTPETAKPTDAAAALEPFVEMMLSAVGREYPYHSLMVVGRDEDAIPPRLATPAFATCFDWHSSVHTHWGLVRALRCAPAAPWATRARAALGARLTAPNLEAEAAFFSAPGREGFERPYGLAWLLQLCAEMRAWGEPEGRRWADWSGPLERLAVARLSAWVERLPWPVRSGEHSQSAFAFGLFLDYARDTGHAELAPRIARHAVRLYAADQDAPVCWEPSGQDFLSPLLGEADLMRRVLPGPEYASWLAAFLPRADAPELERWLTPVASPDPADGKLAHLDGLNLTRAWMLDGIVNALPESHAHRGVLAAAAARHRDSGLAGARTTHYAGTHWLGSFATYLITRRGLPSDVFA